MEDDQDEDEDDDDDEGDDDGDGDDEGEGNDVDPLDGDCLTLCFLLIIPVGHLELLCSFRPSSCFVVSPFQFLLFSISCSAIDARATLLLHFRHLISSSLASRNFFHLLVSHLGATHQKLSV